MGGKYKEVGGGQATGLANDFISFLGSGLNTGTFGGGNMPAGAGAFGSSQGIAGVLNDILSGGGGNVGGSYADMISKQGERDAAALRARFGAGGGTAFGTPAAYAEALLRSETAPKITSAVGGLQLNALSQILPLIAGLSQKGIAQRETTYQQSPWAQAAQIGLPIAGSVLGAIAGGPVGASIGGSLGGMFGGGGGGMKAGPAPNTSTFGGAGMLDWGFGNFDNSQRPFGGPSQSWDMRIPPSIPSFAGVGNNFFGWQ